MTERKDGVDRRAFVATSSAGLALASASHAAAQGANSRLRVGVIGCGGYGNFHINNLLRNKDALNVEIAALCDVWTVNLNSTESVVRQGQRTRPRLFRHYKDLLNRRDIDAVIVATPDFAHAQMVIDAVGAGKDVLCEKPLTNNLAHANQIVDLVRTSDRIVGVGTQRRSDPLHQRAAEWFKTNPIGKVTKVETAWNDNGPRWRRPVDNVRAEEVDWEAFLMHLPNEPFRPERFRRWQLWKDMCAGPPAALGAHVIDVGCWFMDDPLPKSAFAHGGIYLWKDGREHPDTIDCVLEYPKEFTLTYSTRLGNGRPMPEATFYGVRGTFDTRSWTANGDAGRNASGFVEPDLLPAPITIEDPRPPAPAGTNASSRVSNDLHTINFIESVRARRQTSAPVDVGYSQSVASIMCLESWKTGTRQVFDPATRTIRAG